MLDPTDDDLGAEERQFDAVGRYEEPEEPDVGPDVPKAPDTTDRVADVDPELRGTFWALVLVFNVALLATSVGVMLAAFQGNLVRGGQFLVLGLLVFAYGWYRYRQARTRLDEADQNG